MVRIITLVAAIVVTAFASLFAVPESFNYQARLTDSTGALVADGSYTFTFRAYSLPFGGSPLWSESQVLYVSAGLLNCRVGATLPIPESVLELPELYLSIQIDSDPEMTPRRQIVTVPYAAKVRTVDGALGGSIAGSVAIGALSDASGASSLAAGHGNEASGDASASLAGNLNAVTGDRSAILGGTSHAVSSENSVAIGGSGNSITGLNSVALAGTGNVVAGWNALAGGRQASALHNGCFVWNDPPPLSGSLATTAASQFLVGVNEVFLGWDYSDVTLSGVPTIGPNDNKGAINLYHNGGNSHFGYGANGETYLSYSNQGHLQIRRYNGNGTYTDAINIPGNNAYVGLRGVGAPTNVLTLANASNAGGRGLANAWETYSSRRWKTEITSIDGALDKLLRLRGVNYKPLDGGPREIGLVAEEVGEVLPEIVRFEDNGIDARSIDYSRIVAVLIEAVKAQQAQIDSLRQQINAPAQDRK